MRKLSENNIKKLLDLATSSARKGNLFNSAIVIQGEKCIASSESLVITNHNATAHSERMLVEEVCVKKGSHRTPGLVMITVVEPCLMCLSACSQASYDEVIYIIPADKYIKQVPWMSDTKDLDKHDVVKHMQGSTKLTHLKSLENRFSEVFEREMSKYLVKQ